MILLKIVRVLLYPLNVWGNTLWEADGGVDSDGEHGVEGGAAAPVAEPEAGGRIGDAGEEEREVEEQRACEGRGSDVL